MGPPYCAETGSAIFTVFSSEHYVALVLHLEQRTRFRQREDSRASIKYPQSKIDGFDPGNASLDGSCRKQHQRHVLDRRAITAHDLLAVRDIQGRRDSWGDSNEQRIPQRKDDARPNILMGKASASTEIPYSYYGPVRRSSPLPLTPISFHCNNNAGLPTLRPVRERWVRTRLGLSLEDAY